MRQASLYRAYRCSAGALLRGKRDRSRSDGGGVIFGRAGFACGHGEGIPRVTRRHRRALRGLTRQFRARFEKRPIMNGSFIIHGEIWRPYRTEGRIRPTKVNGSFIFAGFRNLPGNSGNEGRKRPQAPSGKARQGEGQPFGGGKTRKRGPRSPSFRQPETGYGHSSGSPLPRETEAKRHGRRNRLPGPLPHGGEKSVGAMHVGPALVEPFGREEGMAVA